MAAILRYGGLNFEEGKNDGRYREGYKGTYDECRAKAATLVKGAYYLGKGTLTGWSISAADGDYAHLDVNYTKEYDESGNEVNLDTSTGPLSSRLATRVIPTPLNQLANYLTNWDHYLAGLGTWAWVLPSFWASATTTNLYAPYNQYYRWVKSLTQLPGPSGGQAWSVVTDGPPTPGIFECVPQKEGSVVDYIVYEITETGKHSSKNNAGWAVSQLLNTPIARPLLGDFGITDREGGDWKISDASIYHNGRFWVSTRKYEKSGDAAGWDPDRYPPRFKNDPAR